jgi:arsenate reductase
LFLCTGNSCRSQMAEGWARHLRGDLLRVESAGLEARGLDPRAVRVMDEAGVDIAGQRSKTLATLATREFDVVVTVCDHARESCPRFPGNARVIHVGFDDPPALARDAAADDVALDTYRRVRDEIRSFVESLPGSIVGGDAGR